jgi:hypothetical protein
MAITYGYFNSVDGDRKYNADQMSEYFDGLVSNGVYESVGGALQVIAGTDMSVNVQTGRGIINCKWINNNAVLPLTITQAHAMLDRYTAVVMKLDITNRLMTITTKDGTAASTPVKPTLQNDATGVELCLAWIYVNAGATTITQDKIEDARPSSDCGWVTGLIEQVDTSTLFLQYQTAYENYYAEMTEEFDTWLSTLTTELNVNTYVHKFVKDVTLTTSSSTQTITLDMTGYTYSNDDIIQVFINGLLGVENTDYTIDTTGAAPVITTTAQASGTVIEVVVFKSKIGFNTLIGSDSSEIVSEDNNTVLI